ncbi:MBL fold metallo-hydrolase [Desulfoluna butyratoxydans]|uniref:Metallo-beta-lactamase n=1 Tax=Desulfoluna butyratoxydans TaxID=231438 RepID=A0A4U8YIR2_9BACT|nr:MBL fold metallo-hydrolase [Desulfoluna butyratoxydans]VFQ43237.1 metallo-beta-lactamase [Desulfoluna butyratoxydans]
MEHILYKVSDDLFMVGLNPPIAGYESFLSAWIYVGDVTFLVDTGPSVTAGALVKALESLGVSRLDYILLTHVHIDHAGAAGDLAVFFPETQVVCHSRGIPHLLNPHQLELSTAKVLGETAVQYGPVRPVSESRLVPAESFMSNSVMPVPTPGHASHHVSYQTDRYLFTGEAAGACFPGVLGISYMRPSTPPPFYYDISLQSLETLMELKPERLCYGHYGSFEFGERVLWQHREQLRLWDSIVTSEISRGQVGADLELSVLKSILETDPLVLPFLDMEGPLRLRELFYLQNSIKGFVGNASRHTGPLS